MANQLYMPNFVQSFNQGYDRGQGQKFNRLVGLAQQDPDRRDALLGEAAQINPGAVAKLQGLQALAGAREAKGQAALQKQQLTAQQDAQKRMHGMTSAMIAAIKSGDPQRIQGVYSAVRPALAQMSGKEPPAQFDPNMIPAIWAVNARTSGMSADDTPAAVTAFNQFTHGLTPEQVQRAREIHLGLAPRAGQPRLASGYQVVQTPNGPVAQPIPIANEQPTQFTEPGTHGGDVSFDFAPGTPPEVIQAAKGAAAASGDIAPQQATPSTLAEAVGPHGQSAQKAPSGYQWNATHTGLQPIPGGPADKGDNYQGGGSAALFGDPKLAGDKYIQSIPEGNRAIVKGLLNGTVALPSGSALKRPLWQSSLASVKHADPTWNQSAYKQFANTRKFFTIGQGGQLINSINTAAQHLDKLREDIQALDNPGLRPLAAIENLGSAMTGGQAVTNFEADLTPVASELAAVYKGKGVPSDEEIRHFRTALTPNMSYGQQMNVIRGWIDLLAGKLNATRSQYQSSMSKLSDPLSVINPRAQDALERITKLANAVSSTGQHEMPTMSQTPIYAPGQNGAPQPTAPVQGGQGSNIDAVLQQLGVQ